MYIVWQGINRNLSDMDKTYIEVNMGKRKLEIEHYLTITTGHIREETARKLEEGNKLDYIDLPIAVFDK